MIYIFADLDGTLIDSRAGQHLIDKKDFDEFSNRTDEYPAFEDNCHLIRVACASSGQKRFWLFLLLVKKNGEIKRLHGWINTTFPTTI